MKLQSLFILSLLFFNDALADTEPMTPIAPSARSARVCYVNAITFFTNNKNSLKISDMTAVPDMGSPIQLGAFRIKSNAESLVHKVEMVVGEGVSMVEEDGFYKVRVTSLDKDKVLRFLDSEKTPDKHIVKSQPETHAKRDQKSPGAVFTSYMADASVPNTVLTYGLPDDTAGLVQQTKKAVGKIIFLNNESPWLKRINYFGKSFALVNALIITIMICIATMISLLIAILLNRRRMEREEKLKQYLSETYQSMIIDYLFTESSPDNFRTIASNDYRRQVLIDQMIDVSANLKGDAAEKLQGLYLYLGLDSDSIKRAYDFRWHKKIKGFRELAFMNIKDANPIIYKALNSKNDILRMEAQIALVRLTNINPFGFLSQLTRPFSLWEQISLHELIIQHDIAIPSFNRFLSCSNPTVVMFALRMIREFKQKDAEDDVRLSLDHSSPEVRRLAVQVSGDMEFRSTLEVMKRMYKEQDYYTCLEIIKAMAKMPDPSLMGFLKLVLDKEDDVQLQIEATKAIENNGEEGVKTLVKLMKSEYKNYNIIVRHVLDRRIF